MGHAFKADIGPGRQKGDADNLTELARLRNKGRLHAQPAFAEAQQHRDKADRDADGEHQHQHHHQAGGRLPGAHAQKPDQRDGGNGDDGLDQIDLIAEDRIEIPDLKRAPHEKARKERNAGGVGPEDGDIGQEHEPGHQKGAVIAEDVFDIVIQAAGSGVTGTQEGVVIGDYQHHGKADQQAEYRAQRPGLGQVGAACHHKGAPADGRAYR